MFSLHVHVISSSAIEQIRVAPSLRASHLSTVMEGSTLWYAAALNKQSCGNPICLLARSMRLYSTAAHNIAFIRQNPWSPYGNTPLQHLNTSQRQQAKLTIAMARLAIDNELIATRAELAAEKEATNTQTARDPRNAGLKKVRLDGRVRLRRDIAELSQRRVEIRAEMAALQGEIAELLNPPMDMLHRQISQQRAQLVTEMEDAIALRARKQVLVELKREREIRQEEWCRKMLHANGHAGSSSR